MAERQKSLNQMHAMLFDKSSLDFPSCYQPDRLLTTTLSGSLTSSCHTVLADRLRFGRTAS